jgi:hypothetical protein
VFTTKKRVEVGDNSGQVFLIRQAEQSILQNIISQCSATVSTLPIEVVLNRGWDIAKSVCGFMASQYTVRGWCVNSYVVAVSGGIVFLFLDANLACDLNVDCSVLYCTEDSPYFKAHSQGILEVWNKYFDKKPWPTGSVL